jgi:hypothetical protein
MAEDEELGVASGGHGARAETGAREKGPRRPDAASGAPISARDRVKLFLANAEYRGVPDVRVSEGPSHLRCAERTCRLADCWNAERLNAYG